MIKNPIQLLEERKKEINEQYNLAKDNNCDSLKELKRQKELYSISIKYLELMVGKRVLLKKYKIHSK